MTEKGSLKEKVGKHCFRVFVPIRWCLGEVILVRMKEIIQIYLIIPDSCKVRVTPSMLWILLVWIMNIMILQNDSLIINRIMTFSALATKWFSIYFRFLKNSTVNFTSSTLGFNSTVLHFKILSKSITIRQHRKLYCFTHLINMDCLNTFCVPKVHQPQGLFALGVFSHQSCACIAASCIRWHAYC